MNRWLDVPLPEARSNHGVEVECQHCGHTGSLTLSQGSFECRDRDLCRQRVEWQGRMDEGWEMLTG